MKSLGSTKGKNGENVSLLGITEVVFISPL